jgi:hypothetical protein
MALDLRIPEELIGAEPKVPYARPGSEFRGQRKKRPIEIGLRHESFEKTLRMMFSQWLLLQTLDT